MDESAFLGSEQLVEFVRTTSKTRLASFSQVAFRFCAVVVNALVHMSPMYPYKTIHSFKFPSYIIIETFRTRFLPEEVGVVLIDNITVRVLFHKCVQSNHLAGAGFLIPKLFKQSLASGLGSVFSCILHNDVVPRQKEPVKELQHSNKVRMGVFY